MTAVAEGERPTGAPREERDRDEADFSWLTNGLRRLGHRRSPRPAEAEPVPEHQSDDADGERSTGPSRGEVDTDVVDFSWLTSRLPRRGLDRPPRPPEAEQEPDQEPVHEPDQDPDHQITALLHPRTATGDDDSEASAESDADPFRRPYWFCFSAILVGLFFLRVLGGSWDTHFPPQFPDALNPGRIDTYYAVAGLTPFRPSFYWAPRPLLYPAFLWVFGRNSHLVVLGQMALYCAAVGALCSTARRVISTRAVANVTILILLFVAVQARFVLWNTQILSESLGISLGMMAVAMWWRVAAESSPRRVTWAWVWTLLWVLTRDSHTVPTLIILAPIVFGIGVLARRVSIDVRRRLVAGSIIAVVVCGYVYAAQQISHRNRYAMYNNIGTRILTDPALRDYFVRGGMPLDAALSGRQGKNAFDDDRFFVDDPSLERFRRWADGPGGRRMLLSLVVRFPDWYHLEAKEWKSLLASDYDAYDGYHVIDALPKSIPFQLGGPQTPDALRTWLLFAIGASCLGAVRSRRRGLTAFVFFFIYFVFIEIDTSFAGDALEVGRHLVGPLNRLSVILVI